MKRNVKESVKKKTKAKREGTMKIAIKLNERPPCLVVGRSCSTCNWNCPLRDYWVDDCDHPSRYTNNGATVCAICGAILKGEP